MTLDDIATHAIVLTLHKNINLTFARREKKSLKFINQFYTPLKSFE